MFVWRMKGSYVTVVKLAVVGTTTTTSVAAAGLITKLLDYEAKH